MTTYQAPSTATSTRLRALLEKAPVRIAVFLICFLWTLPTAGILVNSLRFENDMKASGWWTALAHPLNFTQWTLENYQSVLLADGMGTSFVNSLVVTIPATIIPITIAAYAAYALAWMEFPGRDLIFGIIIVLLVVPLQMSLIPLFKLYSALGLTGSFLGIWLAHTAFGLPLAIYLLYNYISQLPREIFESAWIDGANHFTAFIRLVLPLSVPAIASFAIFQFLWVWNDLLVSLVFLGVGDDVQVVTMRLRDLMGTKGEDWHLLTAGAFISMVVPLTVFLSLQRYFVRGLLAGSVKG